MLHLMDTGFNNTKTIVDGPGGDVLPTEDHLEEGKCVIGKFPKKSKKLNKHLTDENFGAIYMMRDPRDVLVSKHFLKPNRYWVRYDRWIYNAELAKEFENHERVLLVRYEDLLTKPEDIQKQISETFDLEIKQPFSRCHKDFDKEDEANINAMKGARPLDPKRIGSWRNDEKKHAYITQILQEHPEMLPLMQHFSYN